MRSVLCSAFISFILSSLKPVIEKKKNAVNLDVKIN